MKEKFDENVKYHFGKKVWQNWDGKKIWQFGKICQTFVQLYIIL